MRAFSIPLPTVNYELCTVNYELCTIPASLP